MSDAFENTLLMSDIDWQELKKWIAGAKKNESIFLVDHYGICAPVWSSWHTHI